MPRIDLKDGVIAHFIDGQNRAVSRSWSAFVTNPVFIKRQKVRALIPAQLIKDFDRTIAVFEVRLKHEAFEESIYWIFDYTQILYMLSQVMKKDEQDLKKDFNDLAKDELQALEGLAEQGGKSLIRGLKSQDKISFDFISSRVSFYTKDQIENFSKEIPEGLCRIAQCDFEIFGAPGSVMVGLLPMSFVEGVCDWYSKNFNEDVLREWHPVGDTKLNILVADGSEMTRRSFQEIFQEFSVDVIVAKNGEEAMHQVEKNSVDLVVCDLNMPRVNGINFARWFRGQSSCERTPLIFCGQIPNKDILIEAVRAGMNEFIVKPPEAIKVRSLITKYLPEAVG